MSIPPGRLLKSGKNITPYAVSVLFHPDLAAFSDWIMPAEQLSKYMLLKKY